jgi:ribosome-interacting GTPase 1
MTANLTPQYFDAEERYRKAHDDTERLEALREMLQTIPKHKGTEKLQADLKTKIAELRAGGGKKGGARRASGPQVERSGAAQVVLVGPPNSGKSRLLADLSAARPEVAAWPFTTRTPTPGIILADKIPLQFVDLPPVTGDWIEPWVREVVREADLVLIFLDLGSDELLEQFEKVLAVLAGYHVSVDPPPPPEERDLGTRYLKGVLAGGRADIEGAADRLSILCEVVGDREVFPVSLETREGLSEMLSAVVRALDLIRVYGKEPGKPPDLREPFVVARGSTVADVARTIHKELAEKLRFARAWGPRFHDGQPVGRDLVLEDGDILEFHD